MKLTTALAIAAGLGALAACQQAQQNNAAENTEMNATGNMGGTMEMNATGNMDMNAMGNVGNMGESNTATNNVTTNAY